MRYKVLPAIVTIALLMAMPAGAQEADRSARGLADGCAVANAVMDGTADQKFGTDDFGQRVISAGTCYGYIEGFLQGFSAGRGAPKSSDKCIPSGVTTAQIARVVEDRMKKLPELEHLDRMPFLMAVLSATWPCPE